MTVESNVCSGVLQLSAFGEALAGSDFAGPAGKSLRVFFAELTLDLVLAGREAANSLSSVELGMSYF
ncbi:hypothetical protein [uncultured Roseibium sp.]|uniref:hypothetical protein n=1 Tax=uncultured Roseibium sp. TaxID=1936171 RepID=UPI00260DA156|nr:hypothetical protein [uncultured Roseibium sp.]